MSDSQEPSSDVDTIVEGTDSKLSGVTAKVGDVTRRLKPAASAAENVAVHTANAAEAVAFHTVHQSARGLNRVDAYLADRRDRRQNAAESGALPETSAKKDAEEATTPSPAFEQASENAEA